MCILKNLKPHSDTGWENASSLFNASHWPIFMGDGVTQKCYQESFFKQSDILKYFIFLMTEKREEEKKSHWGEDPK